MIFNLTYEPVDENSKRPIIFFVLNKMIGVLVLAFETVDESHKMTVH